MNNIPVAKPTLNGNEFKYVSDCINTTWISSRGKYIDQFEKQFAYFCNVKYAIMVNNGTTALHLALVALGVKEGDEVIVPTVTYIATANAVRYCGAIPIFVDSLPGTLNMNPYEIEKKITKKTRGIIPVHLYGQPADMDAINNIAKKYGLWVLEDAAEAHGASYNGNKVGGLADCAAFSFFGNKIITTGEGGCITTNSDDLAEKIYLYRNQGMDPKRRYWFPVIGYNYRMTNIQAAIGVAQLETIGSAIDDRMRVAHWYDECLHASMDYLVLPIQEKWAQPVVWMYTVYLKRGGEQERDGLMAWLADAGIETRPVFYPLHTMPPYSSNESYPVAVDWTRRGINLPTYRDLSYENIKQISSLINNYLKEIF